jgi:hypothetical protein
METKQVHLIEAAQKALEALEAHADIGIKSDKAIAALRTAIEQAQKQEPVAYLFTNVQSGDIEASINPDHKEGEREMWYREPLIRPPTAPAPTVQEPPCPTCEALARTVMLDQTSHDTTPQHRAPLTDEAVMDIVAVQLSKFAFDTARVGYRVARAIEAAHGIKENT